eukprot:gene2546-3448_t
MLSHDQIWNALDRLAERSGLSPSRHTAVVAGAAADPGSLAAGALESGAPDTRPRNTGSSDLLAGLGPNMRYSGVLAAAAARTGIPAAAIAAIVDAEAGKDCNGSWKTGSRNPRSSAAGLGQFLSGTWQGEAERRGTWLHDTAVSKGWLGSDGRLLPAARAALLALRYDGTASINATADYARSSVSHLKQAGIAIGEDIASVARAAYLGHHLGAGDSVRFLKGGLDSARARLLLDAQVGSANASQRIAQTGDAASAHRSWLLDFVNRHITPSRFGSGSGWRGARRPEFGEIHMSKTTIALEAAVAAVIAQMPPGTMPPPAPSWRFRRRTSVCSTGTLAFPP